jgi:hypothetical protein
MVSPFKQIPGDGLPNPEGRLVPNTEFGGVLNPE